jgi:hypothetical protein
MIISNRVDAVPAIFFKSACWPKKKLSYCYCCCCCSCCVVAVAIFLMMSTDPAKDEFRKFVETNSPTPRAVLQYIVDHQFNGSPALVGMVQRAVRTLAEQVLFVAFVSF